MHLIIDKSVLSIENNEWMKKSCDRFPLSKGGTEWQQFLTIFHEKIFYEYSTYIIYLSIAAYASIDRLSKLGPVYAFPSFCSSARINIG